MNEQPKLDAAKRPNGLRSIADGMIYLAGQTGVETANVWQTADILRAAASEMERLKQERDDAREQLRLANIDCFAALTELNAAREKIAELLGKEGAK